MTTPRITVCVPIFGRPARTYRLIECLAKQNIDNIEVFLIGDGCPIWENEIKGWAKRLCEKQAKKGNRYVAMNLEKNYGGFGYHIRNMMKDLATAPYLCFIDNDDWVKPNHLQFYLSEIENTDLDFVYYNTYNHAIGLLRDARASMGLIGHSELCIRTEFFKTLPNQGPEYGHDWNMIEGMLLTTDKYKKAESRDWTYRVMSTPAKRETNID
jgi:glycosyltransferase involved in cell wall biosynthesis